LVLSNGEVAFDADQAVADFEENRMKRMDELNSYYGNIFRPSDPDEGTYSQETYNAAQMLNEMEQNSAALGGATSFNLGTTMSALMAHEGLGGASFEGSEFGESMQN
jgi:hypothetical protein